MTQIPSDLLYSTEHEWVRVGRDGIVRVGITAEAVARMKTIVDGVLVDVDTEIEAGEPCGEIDTPKANEEIYAPVTGRVIANNPDALTAPNFSAQEDPYGEGWLYEVEIADPGELSELLDAEGYAELIGE